jgi:hypothetical protein
MWKRHVIYESRPRSVIFTLRGHLYRIPEVILTTILPKQCHKVVSHTKKFKFFTICSRDEQKDTATTTALAQEYSIQHKWVEKTEEKQKIPSAHGHLWVNRFNPTNNRFVIAFHKRSNMTSPTMQVAHQESVTTIAFPSPPGTQRNGDHSFLRRED